MEKKFAIVAGYVAGESYGLLGPQMAAALIRRHAGCDCVVVAVAREDDPADVKKALHGYFGKSPARVGFTLLGGRADLVALAGMVKNEGATTILAGPQAAGDYLGEAGWRHHPHRFPGYADAFTFALQGPAEQIAPFLHNPENTNWQSCQGVVYQNEKGRIIRNPPTPWDARHLTRVDWQSLHRVVQGELEPLAVTSGQVLQQIGCPHAAAHRSVEIDYPESLGGPGRPPIAIDSAGCSFCDVAVDKGFFGSLGEEAVMEQITGLPEDDRGRKLPFELINENPLPGLDTLLNRLRDQSTAISRIHLTLRADWLVRGEVHLRRALITIGTLNASIILGSVGFESFDDRILRNLNKGITVADNLAAIRLIRQLKHDFPLHFGYLHEEGGNHGFIHPTPWDSGETAARLRAVMARYRLAADILPRHSTPLIIHHGSALGDWIRTMEEKEGVKFERHGSIIAWWQMDERFLL